MNCHAYLFILCVAVDLSKLDAEVSAAVGAAWSSNTLSTRNSQWKKYLSFCNNTSQTALPADMQTIVRFLVFLARDCKYSTINNYLSAVISLHKFYGYTAEFRDSFLVKLVMRGLRSQLGDSKVQMQPFSVSQLRHIFVTSVITDTDSVIWGAIMLSFRSLLRKSNIVPDIPTKMQHVVRRHDLKFHDWGVMVSVRSSKTLRAEEYVLDIPIYYVSDPIFCVASMLEKHIESVPGDNDGPLFIKQVNGKNVPVLYKEVLAFIKQGVTNVGLSPHEYGCHSLRRAGPPSSMV